MISLFFLFRSSLYAVFAVGLAPPGPAIGPPSTCLVFLPRICRQSFVTFSVDASLVVYLFCSHFLLYVSLSLSVSISFSVSLLYTLSSLSLLFFASLFGAVCFHATGLLFHTLL